jgi:hypothetical protein
MHALLGIVPNGMLLRYIVAEKYSRQDAANRTPEACAPRHGRSCIPNLVQNFAGVDRFSAVNLSHD